MGPIINGFEKDEEYTKKNEDYMAYIEDHINNVKAAFQHLFRNPEKPFEKMGKLTGKDLEIVLDKVEMTVDLHDSSKYTDEEFPAYRIKFYPTAKEKEALEHDKAYAAMVEAEFQLAWRNHYLHNNHHPEYWRWIEKIKKEGYPDTTFARNTPREEPYRMSPAAILHMLCDWHAVSMRFNDNPVNWYNTQAVDERKAMHPQTRKLVEDLLEQLYGVEVYRGENVRPQETAGGAE